MLCGDAVINDSNISYNTAVVIGNYSTMVGGFGAYNLTMKNTEVSYNAAISDSSSDAGGFYLQSGTIENSIIRGNKATNAGGFWASSGNFTIKNSIIIDNNASKGAGFKSGTGATVINCKFINNQVSSVFIDGARGAAFYAHNFTMVNTLITKNNSGIYATGSHKIINSIFYDNTSDIDGSMSTIGVLYNNYIEDEKITISSINNNDIFLGINLGFVDEANGNYRLTASSGLIDAGTTSVTGITLPTTDLDGNPRVSGSNVDIGPYEYQQ